MKDKMKTLIVYYSRTGTTKKVAEEISKALKADIEEIKDKKSRKGALGWLRSGKEAAKKELPEILKTEKEPAKYDLVIFGTPIWAGTMASPLRTYINKNKFQKIAVFTTHGGGGSEKCFKEIEAMAGKKITAKIELKSREVNKGSFSKDVQAFIKNLKQ